MPLKIYQKLKVKNYGKKVIILYY